MIQKVSEMDESFNFLFQFLFLDNEFDAEKPNEIWFEEWEFGPQGIIHSREPIFNAFVYDVSQETVNFISSCFFPKRPKRNCSVYELSLNSVYFLILDRKHTEKTKQMDLFYHETRPRCKYNPKSSF